MRSSLAVIGAILLAPGAARAEVTVSARPEIGLQVGRETFGLAFGIPQPSTTVEYEGSSELTYPLNTTIGGVVAAVDAGSVLFLGSLHTNLHDPWGKMIDSDVLTARNTVSSQSVEFSRTESRTQLRMWSSDLALGVRAAKLTPALRLLLMAGFRYESHAYEIFGASGRQLGSQDQFVPVSLPDDLLVLRYDTRYAIPFAGARLDGKLTEVVSLAAEARFLTSWSSHEDDHVLRNKRARATPFGLGFSLAAMPMVRVATNVHVGLDLQLQYLQAVSGNLSQKYYADDPYLDGDQTQTTISDTYFSYEYLRGRFLLFAEARF